MLKELKAKEIDDLQSTSDDIASRHKQYDQSFLSPIVSKQQDLFEACEQASQTISLFLMHHDSLLERVEAVERLSQDVNSWISGHQRFTDVDSISMAIGQIQVILSYSLCQTGYVVTIIDDVRPSLFRKSNLCLNGPPT